MNKSFGTIRNMFTMSETPIFGIENIENEIRMLNRDSTLHEWRSPTGEVFQINVPPTVYPPRDDTDLMAKAIINLGPGKGRKCLEIGCGSGVLSVLASRQGWKVTACDINPFAVACTKGLAEENVSNIIVNEGGPSPKVDGDVSQWTNGNKFDLVFWNLPYLKPDQNMTETLGPLEEAALLDTDVDGLFERALNLIQNKIMTDSGIALFVVSSQNSKLKPKNRCYSHGFATRVISNLSFDDGEELRIIAVWKPFNNAKKIFVDQLSSTNTVMLDSKHPIGSSICTPKQTSGHGRRGRNWIDTTKSFAGSWKLFDSSTQMEPGFIQILAGICVKDAISSLLDEHDFEKILLKWPNDLLVYDSKKWKKVCGILVESRTSGDNTSVVLGIGINLSGSENSNHDFEMGFLDSFSKQITFDDLTSAIDASLASNFENKHAISDRNKDELLIRINDEVKNTFTELKNSFYRNIEVGFKCVLSNGKMEIFGPDGELFTIDDGESLEWRNFS